METQKMLSVAELLQDCLLETIEINPHQPVISYVRARETIDKVIPARHLRRDAKMRVIEYLKGEKKPGKEVRPGVFRPSFVQFTLQDGSIRKAQF